VDTISTINSTPKPPPPPSTTAQPILPSALLPKLRWANIGWFYHWGIKQYDFTKGKGHIDSKLRKICRNAVASVDWDVVYSGTESQWPDGQPEWKRWEDTYGACTRQVLVEFGSQCVSGYRSRRWDRQLLPGEGHAHGSCRSVRGLRHLSACVNFVSLEC
jgi:hypothetical protein